MNTMRYLVILALLVPTTTFANTVDFNVRDNALWGRYSTIVSEQGFGQLEADGTAYFGNRGRRTIGAGLHVVDNAYTAETPVYVGLGGRLLWVDGGPHSGTVLALGGHGRFTLPDADRVSIGGHLYFAPDVLSFGQSSGYFEFAARGEYQVLQSSWVYLGYRRARANFSGVNARTIDTGLHLGMRINL
jgi:hypothetical protein